MRTREIFAGAISIVLAVTQISGAALVGSELGNEACPHPEVYAKRSPEPEPPVSIPDPSEFVSKDRALDTAYWDTMKILSTSNRCSMFFGGSVASVDVFSNFMGNVTRGHLPAGIGMQMSGDYINVLNAATNVQYRLFAKASLNADGPFYKSKSSPSSPPISGVGSYGPATREGRVLMLLHELGHLMRDSEGQWLLPDDGSRLADSMKNTRTIESVCGEQLRAIDKQDAGPEIVRRNNVEQTVSPAATTSSQQ